MDICKSFKVTMVAELLCWLAFGDLRMVILYGLMIFGACRGIEMTRERVVLK